VAAEPGTGLTVGEMIRDHARRIDELERFRDELKGMTTLIKFVLGTSLLSSVVAIIAIVTVFAEKA